MGSIEHHLRAISSSLHSPVPNKNQSSVTPPLTERTDAESQEKSLDKPFEGSSSFTTHAILASGFVENAVTGMNPTNLSADFNSALSALQNIVTTQNLWTGAQTRFPNQKSLPNGGFRALSLPPMSLVLRILQELKEVPSVMLTLNCSFLDVDELTAACRDVYFAIEEYTVASFIIANAGLYYLFNEKALTQQDPARTAVYVENRTLCGDNLATVLGNLNAYMPASLDNVEALLLGASYAVEASRPSLAWQMNCMAAQMCQSLGYHRLYAVPNGQEDDARHKKASLFWSVYILDRGLALRLGRSPVIADYDISVSAEPFRVKDQMPWKGIQLLWIRQAGVQGKIYEQLYSSRSAFFPLEQKIQYAEAIAEEVKAIALNTVAIKKELEQSHDPYKFNIGGLNGLKILFLSEQVSHYSTLTLIYRAVSTLDGAPTALSLECIDAARKAFRFHLQLMDLAKGSKEVQAAYLQWFVTFLLPPTANARNDLDRTILSSPFLPFIAIFCHIINMLDAGDVQLLRDFALSLGPTSAFSEAIEQLHYLSHGLCKVAALYIEVKSRELQDSIMLPDERRDQVTSSFTIFKTYFTFQQRQTTHSSTMRSSILVGAFTAFNLAAGLFMSPDHPDGVYGIEELEDGTQDFVLIANSTDWENVHATVADHPSDLPKDAQNAARDLEARGLNPPKVVSCAGSKKEMNHAETDWVNSDLDRQCDVGAASRWTRVVAKRGCSVAYYCNFSTFNNHDSLTCSSYWRGQYSLRITEACGRYKPGWGRYNGGYPWAYTGYSYGYENLCDGGQNFCG
ncbi:fungal specific transcription factor domain-containing protein [Sarocladium implicatum]|nr:fungal specific transcription factor domain-containing protein [Sarocladium implicatum]